MAAANELAERRVVPRWRPFREALSNNELAGELIQRSSVSDASPFLKKKESDWGENKELPFAVDLVSAASMFGKSEASIAAANYILENQSKSSNVAINLAKNLLGIELVNNELADPVTQHAIRENLKNLKARRVTQPGNAFVWADLARLYVLLGQKDQARHAIKVALGLAPNERFILRSASRFFLHNKEHDVALKLLRINSRTPTDPWLIAAELAVSTIVNKSPAFYQSAKELIQNNNIELFHKSELASSLASLELKDGRIKKANKLFLLSLQKPTENAIAQYVWASKSNGLTEINPQLLITAGASEARTFAANNNAQWNKVIENAHDWSNSELFSARPRIIAASTNAYFLNESPSIYAFLKDGLDINPGHPGLINSLAFTQAWNGKSNEAEKTINKLDIDHVTRNEAICLIATAGLIFFRTGNTVEGKSFYEKAIIAASKIGNDYLKSLAEMHLAYELINTGDAKASKEFKRLFDHAIKQNGNNLPNIARSFESRVEKISKQEPGIIIRPHLTKIDSLIKKEDLHF